MISVDSIGDVIDRRIADGTIPGAITLFAQDGRVVHLDARGVLDGGANWALHADSLIWLASLSKPITATAVLMLAAQGRLRIDDPVSRFIPEFERPAMVRVWTSGQTPTAPPRGPAPDSVPEFTLIPAQRPISIRDLLTHTSGLQSIGVFNPDFPRLVAGDTLASRVPKLSAVPLDFQPGSRWAYSNSGGFDVLARIVEVASAASFDHFLAEHIFRPLGMAETGFGGSVDRSRAMPLGARAGVPTVEGTTYFSGAAGVWSSASDYARFARMLANGGEFEGRRLLEPGAAMAMTSNQVGGLMKALNGRGETPGLGFGFAVAVVDNADAAGIGVPDGSFGWDGIDTRRFWASHRSRSVLFMYVPNQAVQQEVEHAAGRLM